MAFKNYLVPNSYTIIKNCNYCKHGKYINFLLVTYKDDSKSEELNLTAYCLNSAIEYDTLISKDLNSPPMDSKKGDRYFVAENPIGDWQKYAGKIVEKTDDMWLYQIAYPDQTYLIKDKYYKVTKDGQLVEDQNAFDSRVWEKFFHINNIGNGTDILRQIYLYLKTRHEFSNLSDI